MLSASHSVWGCLRTKQMHNLNIINALRFLIQNLMVLTKYFTSPIRWVTETNQYTEGKDSLTIYLWHRIRGSPSQILECFKKEVHNGIEETLFPLQCLKKTNFKFKYCCVIFHTSLQSPWAIISAETRDICLSSFLPIADRSARQLAQMNLKEMVPLELSSEKPKTCGEAESFGPETSSGTLDTWSKSEPHFEVHLSNTCT